MAALRWFVFVVLALCAGFADAATLTVTNLNDSGAGSLRDQISLAASSGDDIVFQTSLTGTISLSSELVINKGLTITGPTGSPGVTIHGNNAVRCFHLGTVAPGSAITVTLKNLTIWRGQVSGSTNGGAGIRVANFQVSLALENVTISECISVGAPGGGIRVVNGGTLAATSCTFNGNQTSNVTSASGGGLEASGLGGGSTLTNCLFLSNQCYANGGGANFGAAVQTLINCTFSGNSTLAGNGGGACFASGTSGTTLLGCTFNANTAVGVGGGVAFLAGGVSSTVINCTLSGNTAANGGGGLCAYALSSTSGVVNLTNCTIEGNTATTSSNGHGIYVSAGGAALNVTYRNCIISGTGTPQAAMSGTGATLTSQNNNICSDSTANLSGANDLPNTNPNLAALAYNGGLTQTHMPNTGSPAIDKGRFISGVTTDQRGATRPFDDGSVTNASNGDGSDIGAVEANGSISGVEMDIVRNALPVKDGNSDSVTGALEGVISVLSYTIYNYGSTSLSITTPVAAPGNLVNCTAAITTQPSATVASMANTTLVIEVTPATGGPFSCTVSIDNNDPNESPYNWTITGQAEGLGVPQVVYFQFNEASGQTALNEAVPGLGLVNPDFRNPSGGPMAPIWSTPGKLGASSVNMKFGTGFERYLRTDADIRVIFTGTWTIEFWLRGTATAATQCVWSDGFGAWGMGLQNASFGGHVTCTTGGAGQLLSTVSVLDGVWHHVAYVYDGAGTLKLYIDGNLDGQATGASPAITGNNFVISDGVNPISALLDEFRFWSVARTQTQIQNCMNAELVPSPQEIEIVRGTAPIASGGTDTVTGAVAGTPSSLTYTISNLGQTALSISAPIAAPGSLVNCTASVSAQPASMLTPSTVMSTTLVISVTPLAAGPFSCFVTFGNSDANENPYTWTISGTATPTPAPEMDLSRSASPVANGATDTISGAGATVASVLTYTIANTGSATLTLNTPVAAPGSLMNCTAAITTQPAASVGAASSTQITVSVTPLAAGPFSCQVSIGNNDSNENPYTWTIGGTAAPPPAPEMDVSRGASPISNGASDTLGTFIPGTSQTVTYTIANTGTAALNLTGAPNLVVVNLTSSVSSATVTSQPASSISAGNSTNFTVTYVVAGAGAFSFSISINNTDANENPYAWTVSGAGASVPEMDVLRGVASISDGGTDSIGNQSTGSAATITYTISNTGGAALTLTGSPIVAVSGASNCAATVVLQPPASSVAPSTSATFSVDVTPTATGSFSFTLTIANDDANENPYDWTVIGNATTAGGSNSGSGPGGSGCTTSDAGSWFAEGGLIVIALVLLSKRRRNSCVCERDLRIHQNWEGEI